jgi:hypothetical protein
VECPTKNNNQQTLMTQKEQIDLLKKENLELLKELLANLKAMEHFEPHFANRRRIGEVEDKIAKFK